MLQFIQSSTMLLYFVLVSILTVAAREHKVHNVVLFPNKHSWCSVKPIRQMITAPGCRTVEMDNSICVGACFSYSVPKTSPESAGENLPDYCDSCQPSHVTWKSVTLKCNDGGIQKRYVQIISNCSCSSCTNTASQKPPEDILEKEEEEEEETEDLLSPPLIQQSSQHDYDVDPELPDIPLLKLTSAQLEKLNEQIKIAKDEKNSKFYDNLMKHLKYYGYETEQLSET